MKNVLNCTGHTLKIPNIVKAQGIQLTDQSGRQYIDLESGVWCTSLGHADNRINAVIKRQIKSNMHTGFCYSNSIVDEAAGKVLSIADLEGGQCVFLCSGSEAIELLRQVAKKITGRKKTLTLHDAYLGSYSSATDRTKHWYSFNWDRCKTCPKSQQCDMNCEALTNIPDDISEFVFEPGSASGYVRFPPSTLIENIVKIVRANKGKIIVNEVTTGVGRTGKWFGFQHYDIEPDMIAIGKGIGNGYPVSIAVLSRSTVGELEDKSFVYSQSHQNDPLGAAVTGAVIKIIEEERLIEKAEEKGRKFMSRLSELASCECVADVRGRGLMFAVEFINKRVADRIYHKLLERGYIVCNRGRVFRIDPALVIEEEEFFRFVDVFVTIANDQ